jgi:hypothetical protein
MRRYPSGMLLRIAKASMLIRAVLISISKKDAFREEIPNCS